MAADNATKNVSDTASVAEEKAIKTIENVEETNLGKKLPTEIHDIKLCDILKFILMSSTANFLPCYIVYGRAYANFVDYIRGCLFVCYIISSVAVFMFTVVGYASNTTSFFRYCLFSTIAKASFSLVLMFMSNVRQGLTQLILSLIYYFYLDVTDFFLLYYLALYFKRVESDDYDDNGEPLKKDKEAAK
ncbi:hypothetical protein NGRA_0594 [Nosema granulosis]|uniref:Uncharacterized protein n=1 Tax=Nosema granulosis TaxID=83296 RepID=A0A9P6L0E6_9MICR|nr:hypothetical protein NGRA_0594 [Nosema granulosis]